MTRFTVTLAAVLLAMAAPVAAQLPPDITGTRPGVGDAPTVISVYPLLLDVSRVDDADQSFTADFFLGLSWSDPRLDGVFTRTQRVPLDSIWHPRMQILNRRGLDTTFPSQAEIAPDGTVEVRQRYFGTFGVPMVLHDFPLDRQRFTIRLVVPAYAPDEVELRVASEVDVDMLRRNGFSTAEWDFGPVTVSREPFEVHPGGRKVSGFLVGFEGRRYLGYWIGKAFVSVAIIIAMSWVVFWLDPKYVPARMSVSITSMLTLVAYRFLLGGDLPELAYLTRMDHFLIGSTLLVLLTVVQVAATTALVDRDRASRAQRINRHSRWLFPAVFVAWTALAFSIG